MGIDDALRGLVDGAYAAALDDTRWPLWQRDFIQTLGGVAGNLVVLSRSRGAIERQHIFHQSANHVERYEKSGIAHLDPQIAKIMTLTGSGIYVDTDHVDREAPGTAEWLKYARNEGDVDHHMASAFLLGDGDLVVASSVLRSVADGHTPPELRRQLAAIFPDLGRAFALAFRHAEALTEHFWQGVATPDGELAALLDEQGRVVRMTSQLEGLLASGDALILAGRRLHAQAAADDRRLQHLIGTAIAPDRTRSGAARVGRSSGRAALVVTVYPLGRHTRMLAPYEAAALVKVMNPAGRPRTRIEHVREAFGLTPREGEMAMLLIEGHSVESAAAALGISLPTARIHLRHLLAKTDTNRQAELMRLLASMA